MGHIEWGTCELCRDQCWEYAGQGFQEGILFAGDDVIQCLGTLTWCWMGLCSSPGSDTSMWASDGSFLSLCFLVCHIVDNPTPSS